MMRIRTVALALALACGFAGAMEANQKPPKIKPFKRKGPKIKGPKIKARKAKPPKIHH
jgi:hypothetical protein